MFVYNTHCTCHYKYNYIINYINAIRKEDNINIRTKKEEVPLW